MQPRTTNNDIRIYALQHTHKYAILELIYHCIVEVDIWIGQPNMVYKFE